MGLLMASVGLVGQSPAVAAESEGEHAAVTQEVFRITEVDRSGGEESNVDRADPAAEEELRRLRRLELATEAGSGVDTAAVDYCNEEEYAELDGGIVLGHYRYCEANYYKIEHVICSWMVFGVCLREKEVGSAKFRLLTRGEGWDGTMPPTYPNDWVDPRLNQINWVTRLDQWDDVKGDIGAFPLTLKMECDVNYSPGPCIADPLSNTDTRLVSEWMIFGETKQRWLQDPVHGFGNDAIAVFDFHNRVEFMGKVSETTGNSYRCDTATYLIGSRGCMFHKTELYFRQLDLAPGSDAYGEAMHIWEAFNQPASTKPPYADKKIPGNPFANDPKPLTRLYPPYDTQIYDANHDTAVITCQDPLNFTQPYTSGPGGIRMDCDEFPFRATYQGASQAGWNYSAKPVVSEENQAGGRHLGDWYKNGERVLHEDPFYVLLVNSDTGGGGGGGGTPLPVDSPPRVSAGPDVTGNEGSGILLAGSASDQEGTPSKSWSWSAGAGVDAGANCSFTKAQSSATRFTCTDDGTFTVTLTADDGVNAPVSDSATVTVRNVAPRFADGAGVEPWSVYRAGTPVTLPGVFNDPGANDTHTCKVAWDDGGPIEEHATSASACARSRTFEHAGMYTVELTVTDDDGGMGTAKTLVIVYDPDAGFVTAGGHLESPAGALPAQPDLIGKLHLTFHAKYLPGDEGSVPGNGKLKVKLHNSDGEFELADTTLEWLVVTQDLKAVLKGTGKVGGTEGYGFVAYGDGNRDGFRLVAWPLSEGAIPGFATTYDNVPAGDFDVDRFQQQPIKGSVQVHRK